MVASIPAGAVTDLVGNLSTASNNDAVVTGPGSVWSNQADLYVGQVGSGNRLTITNVRPVHDP